MAKNCGGKISNTCGERKNSACIDYEPDLPDFSEIEGCPSIEETTKELYDIAGQLKNQTDLSELGESCLDYVLEEGKIIVKNVLIEFEQKICDLQNRIIQLESESICDKSIVDCNFDFNGLTDQCDNPISTLSGLLQELINKVTTP